MYNGDYRFTKKHPGTLKKGYFEEHRQARPQEGWIWFSVLFAEELTESTTIRLIWSGADQLVRLFSAPLQKYILGKCCTAADGFRICRMGKFWFVGCIG